MAYIDTLFNDQNGLLDSSESLKSIQSEAKSSFLSAGIPTVKDEEWKFTNLSKIFKNDYVTQTAQGLELDDKLSSFDQYSIVLENGVVDLTRSNLTDDSSIEISDLKDKLQDENFVKNIFNKSFDNDFLPLVDVNTALLQGGVYIKVKKGKAIEKPIVIQQLLSSQSANAVSYARIIVEIEANAEATIITSTKTNGAHATISNFVGEIHVAEDARFKFLCLQNDKENASQINNIKITQQKSSVIDTFTISLNGDLIRNNLSIILDAEHIESNFSSVFLLKGKTHVDNHTVADHKFPNCLSNELYKGILDEKSRGVFNGKIFVREDAQKTNAFQSNNNILLSDDAIINTKPQLEIWADDVACSHGCTVGQLDKDAIFYLNTRGIGQKKAKALLLESFAMEVVTKIKHEGFKEYVTALIGERFQNA